MSAGLRQLSTEARQFRTHIIDALLSWGAARYVNEDRFVGTCPVCGDAIGVHFAGFVARATLTCHGDHGGCSEDEVAQVLGLEVRP